MSVRYMPQRYLPNQRAQFPVISFHGERNLPRSRRSSPYFKHEINCNPDNSYSSSKYSREGRHISGHRIKERSCSPRDRSHFSLRRNQEPDLRNLLIASHQHDRKLSDFEREGPICNRPYKDYKMVNLFDWNIDMKRRMNQEAIDLRNRILLSRRDYRDEKYSFGCERDRRFSDCRNEKYDSRRGRYSPDHRDQIYLSEPRREDHFDYRDKIYITDSRQEKHSSGFKDAHLSDFWRGWPSPDGRNNESSDSARWHHDQYFRDFLIKPNRHWHNTDEIPTIEFERDRQHPDLSHQNYLFASQMDSRPSDPRYVDPSTENWRDRYPEQRYKMSYKDIQGMVPISNDPILNELNHQGRRMDYQVEDNWKNNHPSQWNENGSVSNINISEADNRRLAAFSPINNIIPHSEILGNLFITGASLPTIEHEGSPLPKFTVLFQYLYNFHQPFPDEHVEYVKQMILSHWNEEKMKKRKGNWLPTFLEFIPRHNGLAVVCADKRSFLWLLNKKIKGCKGFFFAASDAATPIKRVKLFFQVPDHDVTPSEVLRKFHQCNRGNQINFDRFKVLSCKKNSGNINFVVLSDSWTANKLKKKLNWRPLYGNRRIRMNLMGRKKKKPSSTQPGEIKQPKNEPKDEFDELDEMDEDSLSESYDEL